MQVAGAERQRFSATFQTYRNAVNVMSTISCCPYCPVMRNFPAYHLLHMEQIASFEPLRFMHHSTCCRFNTAESRSRQKLIAWQAHIASWTYDSMYWQSFKMKCKDSQIENRTMKFGLFTCSLLEFGFKVFTSWWLLRVLTHIATLAFWTPAVAEDNHT